MYGCVYGLCTRHSKNNTPSTGSAAAVCKYGTAGTVPAWAGQLAPGTWTGRQVSAGNAPACLPATLCCAMTVYGAARAASPFLALFRRWGEQASAELGLFLVRPAPVYV